jgi:hypothetical protein
LGSIKTAASNKGGIPLLSLTRNHSKGMLARAAALYNARQLDKLQKGITTKVLKEVSMGAAEMVRDAIRAKAPVLNRIVVRREVLKRSRKKKGDKRRPRGKVGRVVAIYHPGNLKRSIKVLPFEKSKALWVGLDAGNGKSALYRDENNVDGWYGMFVEKHNPFIRPAVDSVSGKVMRRLYADTKIYLDKKIQAIK